MYRVSLYLSRVLQAITSALYGAFLRAADARDAAHVKAKQQRMRAANVRLDAARAGAENAKLRLQAESEFFKAEVKAIKEMI